MPTRIIIVGRHTMKDLLPAEYHVVDTVSITWSIDIAEMMQQWADLRARALQYRARLVLQNTPAILLHALVSEVRKNPKNQIQVGIMIMRGLKTRVANVQVEFPVVVQCQCGCEQWMSFIGTAQDIVQFTEPRAVIETSYDQDRIRVTIDPKSPITFERIDWL